MGHYDSCRESDADDRNKEQKKSREKVKKAIQKIIYMYELNWCEEEDVIKQKLKEAIFWVDADY